MEKNLGPTLQEREYNINIIQYVYPLTNDPQISDEKIKSNNISFGQLSDLIHSDEDIIF